MKETIVLNFGGSLVSPEVASIDTSSLKKLKKLLNIATKKRKIILVIGGGKTARHYQKIAKKSSINKNEALDWIGVRVTQLNAEIAKLYLGRAAFSELVTSEKQIYRWEKGILVSGGWAPGNSTDYIASKLALRHKAKKIIIATNVDYLYDKDPNLHRDAKKIRSISWEDFQKSILKSKKWTPGLSIPIDPKATKFCAQSKIKAIFLSGNNFNNLGRAILGKPFKGTIVS